MEQNATLSYITILGDHKLVKTLINGINCDPDKSHLLDREHNCVPIAGHTTIKTQIAPDFIDIQDEFNFIVLFTPPSMVSNSEHEKMFYDVIKTNSKDADLYIVVVDVDNYTNLKSYLDFISERLKEHKYGSVHVIVNANKCKVIFNSNGEFWPSYSWKQYSEITKITHEIIPTSTISPLNITKFHMYRTLRYALGNKLDFVDYDVIGKDNFNLETATRPNKSEIDDLIVSDMEQLYKTGMKNCGYTILQKALRKHYINLADMMLHHSNISFEEKHKYIDIIIKSSSTFDSATLCVIGSLPKLFKKYNIKQTENNTHEFDRLRSNINSMLLKILTLFTSEYGNLIAGKKRYDYGDLAKMADEVYNHINSEKTFLEQLDCEVANIELLFRLAARIRNYEKIIHGCKF